MPRDRAWGAALLKDAIARTVQVADQVGIRAVLTRWGGFGLVGKVWTDWGVVLKIRIKRNLYSKKEIYILNAL